MRGVIATAKTKSDTEGTRGRHEKAETRIHRASFHFGGIRVDFFVDFFLLFPFFFLLLRQTGACYTYNSNIKRVLVKRKACRMRLINKVNTIQSNKSFRAKVRGWKYAVKKGEEREKDLSAKACARKRGLRIYSTFRITFQRSLPLGSIRA